MRLPLRSRRFSRSRLRNCGRELDWRMKRLFPIFLVTVVGSLLMGCSTGKVLSQRSLGAEDQAWAARQKIPLRLMVVPTKGLSATNSWKMQSVSNLATNLTRTGLFAEVGVGATNFHAELLVVTRSASGVMRCGNPAMISKASLGLIRDNVAYSYTYDFDFVSPQTSKTLTFAKTYQGEYRTGFWPARDNAFTDLLKFDLAQQRNEIESLTK
jgi:hypothetical protein